MFIYNIQQVYTIYTQSESTYTQHIHILHIIYIVQVYHNFQPEKNMRKKIRIYDPFRKCLENKLDHLFYHSPENKRIRFHYLFFFMSLFVYINDILIKKKSYKHHIKSFWYFMNTNL